MPSHLIEKVKFAKSEDLQWIKSIADAHRKELGFINRSVLTIALQKREILCVSCGFLHFHHRQDQISTLYHLCVEPEQQRRGFGSQLIEAWEKLARENGITTLRLKCPIDLQANGFYARLGFKRVGIDCLNLIQLDQGKFHQSNDLKIPENILLIFQPPASPELNPIERFWQYLKDNLSWKLYDELYKRLGRSRKDFTRNQPTSDCFFGRLELYFRSPYCSITFLKWYNYER